MSCPPDLTTLMPHAHLSRCCTVSPQKKGDIAQPQHHREDACGTGACPLAKEHTQETKDLPGAPQNNTVNKLRKGSYPEPLVDQLRGERSVLPESIEKRRLAFGAHTVIAEPCDGVFFTFPPADAALDCRHCYPLTPVVSCAYEYSTIQGVLFTAFTQISLIELLPHGETTFFVDFALQLPNNRA